MNVWDIEEIGYAAGRQQHRAKNFVFVKCFLEHIGWMLVSTCRALIGEGFLAPEAIRTPLFLITYNFDRIDGEAELKIIEPYSKVLSI